MSESQSPGRALRAAGPSSSASRCGDRPTTRGRCGTRGRGSSGSRTTADSRRTCGTGRRSRSPTGSAWHSSAPRRSATICRASSLTQWMPSARDGVADLVRAVGRRVRGESLPARAEDVPHVERSPIDLTKPSPTRNGSCSEAASTGPSPTRSKLRPSSRLMARPIAVSTETETRRLHPVRCSRRPRRRGGRRSSGRCRARRSVPRPPSAITRLVETRMTSRRSCRMSTKATWLRYLPLGSRSRRGSRSRSARSRRAPSACGRLRELDAIVRQVVRRVEDLAQLPPLHATVSQVPSSTARPKPIAADLVAEIRHVGLAVELEHVRIADHLRVPAARRRRRCRPWRRRASSRTRSVLEA